MRVHCVPALLGLALLSTLPPVAAANPDFSVTTKVSVEPAVAPHVGYLAKVEIADARSGEVFFAPTVAFKKGVPARLATTEENGDRLVFEITVSEAGDQVTYTLDRVRDQQSVRVQEATITLAR